MGTRSPRSPRNSRDIRTSRNALLARQRLRRPSLPLNYADDTVTEHTVIHKDPGPTKNLQAPIRPFANPTRDSGLASHQPSKPGRILQRDDSSTA